MKNENGITLVALAVTITVLIIIIFISTNTGKDAYYEMQFQAFEAKMKVIQEKVNLEIENYKRWENYGENGITINNYISYLYEKSNTGRTPVNANNCSYHNEFNSIAQNLYNEISSNANINNYYYFSTEDLKEILGIKDIDLNVIINFNTRNIIEKDGIKNPKNTDEFFYTLFEINGNQTDTVVEYDESNNDIINVVSSIEENYGLSKKIKVSLSSEENISITDIRSIYYGIQEELSEDDGVQNVNWVQITDYEKLDDEIYFNVDISGKYQFKVVGANGAQYVSREPLEIVLCNKPILAEGMTPIAWVDNGNEFQEIIVHDTNSPDWYDYSTSERRWANARTQDGSYWVWIPRYKYLLDNENQTSYIKFVYGITESSTDGKNSSNYKNCPCFKDGKNSKFSSGEWDKELTGIWVSKYDASRADSTYSDAGSLTYIKVVPSVISYRSLSHKKMFEYCRNMEKNIMSGDNIPTGDLINGVFYNDNNNVDTHLMKNSEWGAIVYLSWSKYGLNKVNLELNNTSNYITGGDTELENVYRNKTAQSNTHNLYGIYDLVGCSNEVVSAGTDIADFVSENKSSKYATLYTFNYNDNNILGDSIRETRLQDGYAWENHYFKYYLTAVGEQSVFIRGGGGVNSTRPGLFYLTVSKPTNVSGNIGFRPVLIVE